MTIDPTGWSATDVATAIRGGAHPRQIVEATLALLAHAPPGILIGPPLEEAALADCDRLSAIDPTSLPLYAVPFVVKDNIDVAGVATTAACPGAAYLAATDAEVVARVRAAGAIVVGKANLDQFATGLVGTRSPYGTPLNALDPTLVPGGSSSGSAVAVALGLVPFALGTDTAGSGRVPAALNGIVGIKPTVGSMSTRGLVPAMRPLDCPSVFARNIADAALVARTMRGRDRLDPWSRSMGTSTPMRSPASIGVPAVWPDEVGIDGLMLDRFESALDVWRALGARIVPIDIQPLLDLGAMLYGSALVAERAAAFGDAFVKDVSGLDPIVAGVVQRARQYTAVDACRAGHEVLQRRLAVDALWSDVDLLALPTTPTLPTLNAVERDPIGVNEALGRLTTFVNLADACCIAVPMQAGVPAGLQLIAPAWQDEQLVTLATAYVARAAPAPCPS
jgi:allophanate hydrolase